MYFTHILAAFRFLGVVALALFVTLVAVAHFMVIRFRIRAYRSPLRSVPGPRKTHWLKGNFPDVQEANAMRLQEEWVKTYGHVLKYYSFLGVRFILSFARNFGYLEAFFRLPNFWLSTPLRSHTSFRTATHSINRTF